VAAAACSGTGAPETSCIDSDGGTIHRRADALSVDDNGCLDAPRPVDSDGHVPCVVMAVGPVESDFCTCDAPGYSPSTAEHTLTARKQLGEHTTLPCQKPVHCFCTLTQLSGSDLSDCRSQLPVEWERRADGLSGWCYVDPDDPATTQAALDPCGADVPRIRTLGPTLRPVVTVCSGPL
jgi:hypothetical protein